MPILPILFPANKHVQAKTAVDQIVDWFDAASPIRDLNLVLIAKRKWATVLAGLAGEILFNMTDN